jgi:hypothetical protein
VKLFWTSPKCEDIFEDVRRLFRIVSGAVRQLLPLLTLGGISMCLSAISFFYFVSILADAMIT